MLVLAAVFMYAQFANAPRTVKVSPDGAKPKTRSTVNAALRGGNPVLCDTTFLDWNSTDELRALVDGLNYRGSWNGSQPEPFADELTAYVDKAHEFMYRYVQTDFDSLLFADQGGGTPVFFSRPLANSTITFDSLFLFGGISGDTTKMANDSIIISVFSKVGTVRTLVKTVVLQGPSQFSQLLRDPGFIGGARLGVNHTFNQGEGFSVRLDYLAKDTSSHFLICYGFTDSCGTITFNGQQFASPAKLTSTPPSLWGFIQETATGSNVFNVNNQNSGFAYNLTGIPANCRFVYTQNWQLIPEISVCSPYGASITASKQVSCPGATVDLSAFPYGSSSQNFTFNWTTTSGTLTSTSSANVQLIVDSTALVTVTVNDGTNTTSSTILITSRKIGVNIPGSNPLNISCGANANLVAQVNGFTTGTVYSWSTGAVTPTLSVNTPGNYNVTVTNNAGCTASTGVTVQYPSVSNNVNFNVPPAPNCAGRPITFTNTSQFKNGWSYSWTFGDGNLGFSENGVNTYASAGQYSVRLTQDSAGCVFNSPVKTITILPATNSACLTSIEDLEFNNNVSVTPNPSTGNVTLTINGADKNVTVKVFNIIGSEVKNFRSNDVPATFTRALDLSDLSTGTYLVKIQTGDKAAVKRITISK